MDREQATILFNILTQDHADLQDTTDKLDRTLQYAKLRKLSHRARVQASLRDKTTGLYVSVGQGMTLSAARLLVAAVKAKNEPGLHTLIGDLRRIIAGTVPNGSTLFPFLPTEGILQKA